MMSVLVCPDPAVLEALATGGVAAEERPALDAHLDSCPACGDVVAQLARIYAESDADVTVEAASGDGQSVAPPSRDDLAGQSLGRYQLGRQLGSGGMGVVFEALDPELDRQVAIKLLHGGRGAAALKARLLREARAMARLQHPNVVAVHDIGAVGDEVFIAMELVEGATLTKWLAERKRSTREVVRVFVEAGRGLEAAHAVDMVHRDFKPDNVLIGADGRARVTDFGLARPIDDPPPSMRGQAKPHSPSTTGMSLTRTAPGAMVGTPAYMSPEQLKAQPADARSDQFAFCVALFEALTSQRPFRGASFEELARNVLAGQRDPTPSSVPRWLRAVLDRGLSPDPGERYPTMRALLSDLERDRGKVKRAATLGVAMTAAAAATVGVLYLWTGLTTPQVDGDAADAPPGALGSPTCTERNAVTERWSSSRQDAFRTALSQRAISDERLPEAVMKQAQTWTEAWTKQHDRLCRSKDAERARLRTCLTRRFRAFDAIVAHVTDHRDSYANERALTALSGLGSPEACGVRARLAVQPLPVPEPDAEHIAIRSQLDALGAAVALGQAGGEREAAAKLVDRANATGHAPTHAEALLLQGRVELAAGAIDDAATTLEESIAVARTAGHDEAVSDAALMLAHIELERLRPEAIERWLRILEADAARFDDRALEAEAMLVKGRSMQVRGDFKDAVDPLRKALNLSRSAFGDQHARTVVAYLAYSDLMVDLERLHEADEHAREAVKISKALAGDRSLLLTRARAGFGRVRLAKGEAQAALQEFDLAASDQLLGTPLTAARDVTSRLGIAAAHEALKNFDKAGDALAAAERAARRSPQHAHTLSALGAYLVRRGTTEDGLSKLRAALQQREQDIGPDDMRLVSLLRALGRAQTRAKRVKEARVTFERALAIIESGLGYEPLRAFVHEELAEAERVAESPKARLKQLDEAHVLLSSAYGHEHERTVLNVLTRADLAYELGRKTYAGRLYRGAARRLKALLGEGHPDVRRAEERATPKEQDGQAEPVPETRATDVKKELRERIREIEQETRDEVNRKLDGE